MYVLHCSNIASVLLQSQLAELRARQESAEEAHRQEIARQNEAHRQEIACQFEACFGSISSIRCRTSPTTSTPFRSMVWSRLRCLPHCSLHSLSSWHCSAFSNEYIRVHIALSSADIMQVLMTSLLLCAGTVTRVEPDSSRQGFSRPWVAGWAHSTANVARWRSSSASYARVVAVVRWRASAPSRLAAALRAAGVAR